MSHIARKNVDSSKIATTYAARTHLEHESPVLMTTLPDGTPVRLVPTWGKAYPHRYSEYVQITPEIAREMLAKNTNNRKLNVKASNRLAWDIHSGHWQITHQGIAFDKSGTLADGQHRLQAICVADTPAVVQVCWNQPTIGGPIDCGQKRTNVQQGLLEEPNVPPEKMRARHEICSMLVQIENEGFCTVGKATSDDKYASMKEEIDWIVGKGRGRRMGAAVRAAFAYAYPIDPEKIAWAWDRFLDGDGLTKRTPIYTLREHLGPHASDKRQDSTGSYSSRAATFRRVLRALMAHLKGKPLGSLADSNEGLEWFRHQRKVRVLAA